MPNFSYLCRVSRSPPPMMRADTLIKGCRFSPFIMNVIG